MQFKAFKFAFLLGEKFDLALLRLDKQTKFSAALFQLNFCIVQSERLFSRSWLIVRYKPHMCRLLSCHTRHTIMYVQEKTKKTVKLATFTLT